MNKFMVFGSIFTVFLLLMIPIVKSTEYHYIQETNKKYFNEYHKIDTLQKSGTWFTLDELKDLVSLNKEYNRFSGLKSFLGNENKNIVLSIILLVIYLIGVIFTYPYIEEIYLEHGEFYIGEVLLTILESLLNPEVFPPILLPLLLLFIGPILSVFLFLIFANNYFPFFMSLMWPLSLPVFIFYNAGAISEDLMQNLIGSICIIGYFLFSYLLSITSLIINAINLGILTILTIILKILERNTGPIQSNIHVDAMV